MTNEIKFDVTALGELLIDFTENGLSGQGNGLFEANPGGAPCNVLAMLKKLGRSCAFVGKVGEDMFGHLLRDVAAEAGICMDYLVFDEAVRTTLAFVKTFPNGDRDFSFYRNPGAEKLMAGCGNNSFLPDRAVTREQLAAVLHRYANWKGLDIKGAGSTAAAISDEKEIAFWALASVRWAVQTDIVPVEESARFAPEEKLTADELNLILAHIG